MAPSRLRIIPILLAQGFGILCGVAGVKINSYLIAPETLGIYGIFLTFAPIGVWVVHAGLVKFVVRHWANAPSRPALWRSMINSWLRRLPWLAIAALAGAVALWRFSPAVDLISLAPALFVAAALLSATALAQSALQAERAHWRDCFIIVCTAVTRTFLPAALFFVSGGMIAALWLGFSVHAALTAAAAIWMLRRYWRSDAPAGDPPLAISAVYRGPMFVTLAAAAWILSGLNRWIVAGAFGEVEAGYFTLAGSAAVVVASTVGTVFMQYFQPGVYALADNPATARASLARRVDIIALVYAFVALAAVALLAWCGPWLVGGLIRENYRASLAWLLPAGCFGVATITTVFYQTLLLAGRRERACGPVELTTAAVLIVGGITAAAFGREWFGRWLMATPLVPWCLTRPLTRHYFLKPDEAAAPAPAR
jgi:hypothetical protein